MVILKGKVIFNIINSKQRNRNSIQNKKKIKLKYSLLGDLGKAVGELVTVMTNEDLSKTNGQRAPPPAFK